MTGFRFDVFSIDGWIGDDDDESSFVLVFFVCLVFDSRVYCLNIEEVHIFHFPFIYNYRGGKPS